MAKKRRAAKAKPSSSKAKVGEKRIRLPSRLIGLLAHCVALLHPTKGNMGELRRVKRTLNRAKAAVVVDSSLLSVLQSVILQGGSVSDVENAIAEYRQAQRVNGEDDEATESWILVEETGPGYERAAWVYAMDVELNSDEARVVLTGFERASKEGEKDEPDPKIAFPTNTGDDVYLLHDCLMYWKDENAEAKDRPAIFEQWEHENPVSARYAREAHEARERLLAERAEEESEAEKAPETSDSGASEPDPVPAK